MGSSRTLRHSAEGGLTHGGLRLLVQMYHYHRQGWQCPQRSLELPGARHLSVRHLTPQKKESQVCKKVCRASAKQNARRPGVLPANGSVGLRPVPTRPHPPLTQALAKPCTMLLHTSLANTSSQHVEGSGRAGTTQTDVVRWFLLPHA